MSRVVGFEAGRSNDPIRAAFEFIFKIAEQSGMVEVSVTGSDWDVVEEAVHWLGCAALDFGVRPIRGCWHEAPLRFHLQMEIPTRA